MSPLGMKGSQYTLPQHKNLNIDRIEWHPIVLTFSFPSKDSKNGKDPLIKWRSKLEELDIKTVLPFAAGVTTYVVANKRNTAKCLQALVHGLPVVNFDFLHALLECADAPGVLDEPESQSLLEQDFDAHWPKACDYLPYPREEPGKHPAELFEPSPTRREVFTGYTFVFGDKTQYETLRPPISDGGGKALHCPVQDGETTAAELVAYMKKVGGETCLGPFADGGKGPGVVLVRFGGKDHGKWADELHNEVRRITQQECVQQNEFLDAILTSNALQLRRPLPPAPMAGSGRSSPSNGTSYLR